MTEDAGRRFLVVDDEPVVRTTLRTLFVLEGYTVEEAASGEEALSLFERNSFDLVITDYAMTRMKGDELAAEIKARVPHQPVIMITAYAESLRASGKPMAAVDFIISKPFELSILRKAVARLLS